ncbi:hypothetical protein PF008_g1065 [Phytophthora fragariae]|uniref:Uncharacterized protein n=1 Tax=Phytophthora fragariae TaxID=53985 RepID=A0A6G0SL47_9STRA|nr:hypothetical protein PF008_g1065 [Phytophthora fragariae]
MSLVLSPCWSCMPRAVAELLVPRGGATSPHARTLLARWCRSRCLSACWLRCVFSVACS